ncbi:hypothetical protein [Vibrio atypicus]|uniref:hypothetical protein n=1 Tax=Vibrio atypicus TaxID=558271 RepID=UPI00135B989D|nr:hypothetical protein [Vibrio atypicus]
MSLQKRTIRPLLTWLFIFIAAAHCLLTQTHYFLNADVAFLTQMALFGQNGDLYTQYYEINPPLIVFIYRLFLIPFELGWLTEVASLRVSMVIYLLLVFVGCHYYLAKLNTEKTELWLLAIALSLLFVLPAAFLQREHIIAAAMMLYLCMMLCRLERRQTSIFIRATTATLAALAVCLKPQYGLVLILLELYYLAKERRLALLFRWENILIAMVGTSYISYVYFAHPYYFQVVAPLASKTYIAYFEQTTNLLLRTVLLLLLLLLPFRYLKARVQSPGMIDGFYLVAFAALGAFLAGRAGFSYHLVLSFTVLSTLVLASLFFALYEFVTRPHWKQAIPCGFFIAVLLFIRHFHFIDVDQVNYPRAVNQLMAQNNELPTAPIEFESYKNIYDAVRQQTSPHSNIYVFGARLFPAHSIAIHLNQKWIGRFPVLWALPETLKEADKQENKQRIEWIAQTVAEDITNGKPEVILVEKSETLLRYPNGFDFIEHFEQIPSFAKAFEPYQQIEVVPSVDSDWVLYKRVTP